MNIKTITTIGGVNEVDFGSNASRFYWFRNVGTTTVHVSGKADIAAGGDGVAELAAGDSVCIETLGGKVYVLGAGKVQIHNTGDKFCPFKNAPVSGDGGKSVTVSNPNLLINPDFRINQRGISGTFSDTGKYFVDRWRLVSGTVTVNSDGTLTLNGDICQPLENAVGTNVTASVSAGTAVYDNTTQTFTITGNGDVISWAKLEYGNAATAFIPPEPTTEMMKCKRYYRTMSRGALAYAVNAASVVFVDSFEIPMRIDPTAKILSPVILSYCNGWLDQPDVTEMSIISVNLTKMGACYIHVSGFNVTVGGTEFASNYSFRTATDNFIGFDAEIYLTEEA